jgi:hypothetical protein
MLQKISTDKAPAAIGPYSQGIVLGNIFFASGQIPIDPATGEIYGTTIEEQAEQEKVNYCQNDERPYGEHPGRPSGSEAEISRHISIR